MADRDMEAIVISAQKYLECLDEEKETDKNVDIGSLVRDFPGSPLVRSHSQNLGNTGSIQVENQITSPHGMA